jgi:hypothetical protein
MNKIKRAALAAWGFVVRVARCAKTLMTSKQLPLWLRGMFILVVTVCQVLLGPFDDLLMLIPFALTWIFFRPVLLAAWRQAARKPEVASA